MEIKSTKISPWYLYSILIGIVLIFVYLRCYDYFAYRNAEYRDKDYSLLALFDQTQPVILSWRDPETTDLEIKPGTPTYDSIMQSMDGNFRTLSNQREARRKWHSKGFVDFSQNGKLVFKLRAISFADVPRRDGSMELCRIRGPVRWNLREILKKLGEQDRTPVEP